MPWKVTTPMMLRQEFVQLAETQTVPLSELCRRFGISRKTGYKVLARVQAQGPTGLADRSRQPHTSPAQTPAPLERALVALRQAHPAWGARKLRARLTALGQSRVPAASTITRILHRHGLIGAPARPPGPWRRFEAPVPNALWQMDFKGRVATLAGWGYPLTLLDDHSRYNLSLQILADQQRAGVQATLTASFRQYGLPDGLLVDNGSPWGHADTLWTRLTVWLVRVGSRVWHSRPYHPQTLGKDERFHRTLETELLGIQQWRDPAHCQVACDRWRSVYNTERPHEALGFAVPASRYRPSLRAFPEPLPPIVYPAGLAVRKVQSGGHCSFQGYGFTLPQAFTGCPIALRPTGCDGVYDVLFCHQEITQLNLRECYKV